MDAFMVVLFVPAGFLLGLAMVLKTWPPIAVILWIPNQARMASQEAWVYAQVRSTELSCMGVVMVH